MPNFTKAAIKQSFLKLLDLKPLNQITVKDIVEDCGINRNSFYYHFQDIPALIEEIITEEADEIISCYPTVDSIETCLTAALMFAKSHKRAIMHIFNSVNRDIFEQYLWKVCGYVVNTYGKTAFADKPIKDSDRELITRFYICECFGLAIDWMNTQMGGNEEAYISRLCFLKKGMMEEMIKRSLTD